MLLRCFVSFMLQDTDACHHVAHSYFSVMFSLLVHNLDVLSTHRRRKSIFKSDFFHFSACFIIALNSVCPSPHHFFHVFDPSLVLAHSRSSHPLTLSCFNPELQASLLMFSMGVSFFLQLWNYKTNTQRLFKASATIDIIDIKEPSALVVLLIGLWCIDGTSFCICNTWEGRSSTGMQHDNTH